MICTRCQGLMHEETIPRRHGPGLMLWACYACGDRVDDTIKFHRVFRREETTAQRNERIFRQAKQAFEELALSSLGSPA